MDSDFLDYEHTQMLNDLGLIRKEGENLYPSYWEVKKCLWEKYKMVVCVDINRNKENHCCIRNQTMDIIIPADILSENWKPDFYDSPITAEIEAIKKVILELYKKFKE